MIVVHSDVFCTLNPQSLILGSLPLVPGESAQTMIHYLTMNNVGLVQDRKEKRLWLFSKLGPDDDEAYMNTEATSCDSPISLIRGSLRRWDWLRPNLTERRKAPMDLRRDIRILPEVREPVAKSRGEILILTDDLNLVLPLRYNLLLRHYDLNWTSNFWLAMSYLHSHRFSSLIFDMRVRSVEEKFVPDFVEEYGRGSKGKRVFLATGDMSPVLRRLLREKGSLVLEKVFSSGDLVEKLELSP